MSQRIDRLVVEMNMFFIIVFSLKTFTNFYIKKKQRHSNTEFYKLIHIDDLYIDAEHENYTFIDNSLLIDYVPSQISESQIRIYFEKWGEILLLEPYQIPLP